MVHLFELVLWVVFQALLTLESLAYSLLDTLNILVVLANPLALVRLDNHLGFGLIPMLHSVEDMPAMMAELLVGFDC
ncbi:hypothetical protein DD595_25445 [Enterobacter cloacae complex sp. 4DZ3-17B2]|nr:hypothetical protein DD595_25445 [Enterobacter cloacae complex sp. 4DZ3-17B2]